MLIISSRLQDVGVVGLTARLRAKPLLYHVFVLMFQVEL
jgi:hypothetical protein